MQTSSKFSNFESKNFRDTLVEKLWIKSMWFYYLNRSRSNEFELIKKHEIRVENCHVDRRVLANLTQISHHLFLVVGVGDVDCLDEEAWRLDFGFIFVELDVKREWISRIKPILKELKIIKYLEKLKYFKFLTSLSASINSCSVPIEIFKYSLRSTNDKNVRSHDSV